MALTTCSACGRQIDESIVELHVGSESCLRRAATVGRLVCVDGRWEAAWPPSPWLESEWIAVYGGTQLRPLECTGTVRVEAVAHAMSLRTRFNCHVDVHYSTAQHCVLGARHILSCAEPGRLGVPTIGAGDARAAALAFLTHDVCDFALPDVPGPMKPRFYVRLPSGSFEPLAELEERVIRWVRGELLKPEQVDACYSATVASVVEQVDAMMLKTEARDLQHGTTWWLRIPQPALPSRIVPWTAELAMVNWLDMLAELT